MATIITGRTGQLVYPHVIRKILKHGEPRTSRSLPASDLGYTVIELESPNSALPVGCGRNISRNVAAAEAVQLIGGFSYTELLTRAAPATKEYTDDGVFHGSYGQRIGLQVLAVARKLTEDPGTRQAVITLWDPMLDNQIGKHDYPCTVMIQFETRDNRLDMNVVMRSNDAWLGLPYDMFQFAQLQLTLSNSLTLLPGRYRHTALSLHLYQKDIASAHEIEDTVDFSLQPLGIGRVGQPMATIMKRARALTVVDYVAEDRTTSERWYSDRFASYMG